MTGETVIAPRANPTLIGHNAAEATLLQSWRSGKVPHAWLIAGERGIGKATLAYRFARFVLAGGKGPSLDLPVEHPVFRQVAAGGAHSDLLIVERSYDEEKKELRRELRVEDAREIGRFLHMTSTDGEWRVVVVDAVDDFNPNAANAILKILEEPPAPSLLLLVSHAPGRLLPTIRSRCRRLPLTPPSPADCAAIIRQRFPAIGDSDLETLIVLAEGSPGKAIELWGEGGLDLYREMLGLLNALPRIDIVALHALADRLGRSGAAESRRLFHDLLAAWLGRLIRRIAQKSQPSGPGIAGENALIDRIVQKAGRLDPWLETWDKVGDLVRRADTHNLDPRQVLLNVFLAVEAAARA